MKKIFLYAALTVLLIPLVLAGCTQPLTTGDTQISIPIRNPAPSYGTNPTSMGMDAPTTASYPEKAVELSSQVSSNSSRLIIQNAYLKIRVNDPQQALQNIEKLALTKEGFLVNSNLYQRQLDNGNIAYEASITLRVPAKELSNTLDEIKKITPNPIHDVLSESVSGQDVTAEYIDLQARLDNLQVAEKQMRDLLQESEKTEDILRIYQELRYLTEQIEVLKGQMQYYEQSAKMSLIQVDILSEDSISPIDASRWQPKGVARNALQSLVDTYRLLVNGIIWAVLYLIPLLLPFGLIALLLRRVITKTRPPFATPKEQ